MSKAMMEGCVFCLVALAAVAVSATPLAPSDRDDGTCLDALKVCGNQALAPFIGLNQTAVLARIRNTPLYEHCSDFKRAGDCVREKIKERSCSRINSTLSLNITIGLDAHGFALNYVCTQHYSEIPIVIRCLTTEAILNDIWTRCTYTSTDPDKTCETAHKTVNCAEAWIRTRCGSEAASLYKDFNVKLLEKFSKFVLGKDCSYKGTNHLEVIKKILASF